MPIPDCAPTSNEQYYRQPKVRMGVEHESICTGLEIHGGEARSRVFGQFPASFLKHAGQNEAAQRLLDHDLEKRCSQEQPHGYYTSG